MRLLIYCLLFCSFSLPFSFGQSPLEAGNNPAFADHSFVEIQPIVKNLAGSPENCANSTPIICGQSLSSTTIGAGNEVTKYNGSVQGVAGVSFNGQDRLFTLTVSAKTNMQIVLQYSAVFADLDVLLLNTCSPANVVAASTENVQGAGLGLVREVIDINSEAGVLYIMVDGKKSTDQGSFTLSVQCKCECREPLSSQPNGDKIWADDFENYLTGNLAPQSSRWDKWSASGADASVANESILGLNKIALFAGTATARPDLIYKTNNNTSGRFRLSWRTKITTGKKGYFDLLHILPGSSAQNGVIAYSLDFKETGAGDVILSNGQTGTIVGAKFNYRPGAWINVTNIVDIDKDVVELWIDDVYVGTWKFSSSISANATTAQRKTLAGISFWAKDATYSFAVDNICIWQKKSNCTFPLASSIVYTEKGDKYNNMPAASCDLYTDSEIGNYTSVCDLGGPFIDRGETYSGVLDLSDEAPTHLKLPSTTACNISAGTAALYSDIYSFINTKKKTNGQPEDIIVNFTGSSGVRCHIFTCQRLNTAEYTGVPNCLGSFSSGQSFTVNQTGVHPDIVYYIVFSGPLGGIYKNFSIVPEGFCQSGAVELPLEGITSGSIGSGNGDPRFSASGDAYKSCYNGKRSYTGQERVYKFTIVRKGIMSIKLKSAPAPNFRQLGMFLYSSICGGSCLDYGENITSDSAFAGIQVTPGVYYVVVDRNTTPGTANFILETKFLSIIPSARTCNFYASASKTHSVVVPQTAYPFTTRDALTVLYDAADGKLKQTESEKIENLLDPVNIGISDSCDYKANERFKIYLYQQDGTNRRFYAMNLAFVPAGVAGNTGSDRFERAKRSTIERMTTNNTARFGTAANLVTFVANPVQPERFLLNTNKRWRVVVTDNEFSETPATDPWLTVTPATAPGAVVVSLSARSYTGVTERNAVVRFYAEEEPHVWYHTIQVRQFGVNSGRPGGVEDRESLHATEIQTMSVVPNPASGRALVQLDLNQISTVSLHLWDGTGRVIQVLQPPAEMQGHQMWDIDLSGQPSGLYHLVGSVNGQLIHQTLVLQR